ncbi:hypothetical protein [Nocardiopsis chromatogenes]|uniref:hypothetical protein n=1 Tax=Nocardiopsis chromatogenes TaxID=280239 RepID=UPI00034BA96F|nr:hypothetical protein [Nocardiopsis chromatogenes]
MAFESSARILYFPRARAAEPDPVTEHADDLYDALSEALNEREDGTGQGGERYEALQIADAAFTALDEHLRSGGVLPTPWKNAARPDSH